MCLEKSGAYIKVLDAEAKKIPPDVGNSPDQLPPWLDKKRFKRGQQLYYKCFFSLMVSMLCGLLCLMVIPNIVNVLVFTKRSSIPKKAFVRYFSTLRHVISWFQGDLWDKNSLSQKSVLQVRALHSSIRKRTVQHPGLSISQLEMVQTQWAFFALGFLYPRKFGMKLTHEDEEGLLHFWRSVGYLIGIDDKYNLCSGSVEETKHKCREMIHLYFKPSMLSPPPVGPPMSEALIEGMRILIPVLSYKSFMVHVAELLDLPQTCKPALKGWDNLMHCLYVIVCQHAMLLAICSFLRSFLNFLLWITVNTWMEANKHSRIPNFQDITKVILPSVQLARSQ